MGTWVFIIALIRPTNPWSVNDWQPLREQYGDCQVTARTSLHYWICADRAYREAQHPTYYA
jgi:hypothetical protein